MAAVGGLVPVTVGIRTCGEVRSRRRKMPKTTNGESGTVSTEVEIDRNLWGLSLARMGAALKTQVSIGAYFERV
jgi:hypothetical protein